MKRGEQYGVGILGATGLVGQRLIERLVGHPWFRVVAVAASNRSAGRRYHEAADWRLPGDPPREVASLTVQRCEPAAMRGCDLVFSSLDATTARNVEGRFAREGMVVVSNSSAFRYDDDVPLLIPEVNASHLDLVSRRRRQGRGFIVTNPNCSVIGLAMAVAPLQRPFGIRRVMVVTLQAISGAGIEGPRALELLDNAIPFIPGEEEKIEREIRKILGTLGADGVIPAELEVSAHCHRVCVVDGHLEAVSLELSEEASPERVSKVLEDFSGDVDGLNLPSAPPRPLIVRAEPDRPQPKLDRDAGLGMAVVVGRVRPCSVLGIKLELLSHNTVRGAAGGTLLVAELLASRGLLSEGREA